MAEGGSVEPTKAEASKARLTEWVFAHSERISRKTARQIVELAMDTDKGLLILSILQPESNYVPSSASPKGAVGLGQIHYKSHAKLLNDSLGITDIRELFDIESNIKATNLILTNMLTENRYDINKTLRAYLGGQDGIYVNRICQNYVELSLLLAVK